MLDDRSLTLEAFAASRGFTEEELRKYEITVKANGQVLIPILRGDGQSWGNRIYQSNGRPKYRFEAEGVGLHLYNPLGLGPHSDEVWLAEGEFDTLSLVVVGAQAVGVLGVTGFRRAWKLLFEKARVVVAFDPDSESDEQAQRVREVMALFPNVRRFDPLKVGGYSDINEWLKADRDDLEKTVKYW